MRTRTHKTTTIVLGSITVLIVICSVCFFIKFKNYIAFGKQMNLNIPQTWMVYGPPSAESEWLFNIILSAEREDWEKVALLTQKDRESEIGTYYHNIAMAKQGKLSQELMNYYQPFERGLFIPIQQGSGPLSISCAGEIWYQLGQMTFAEHAAMLGLAFSAKQEGKRFYQRLAQINHIYGDEKAVKKYERLLGSKVDDSWKDKVQYVPQKDTILFSGQNRKALQNLLDSNPNNIMAYEYLLCYDLLRKDIGAFIEDYDPKKIKSKTYDQAILIYLAGDGILTKEQMNKYDVNKYVYNEFCTYTDMYIKSKGDVEKIKSRFGNTYWFWYHFAERNE